MFVQEARGHSGGIWILTCKDDLACSLIDNNQQVITFSIQRRNVKWFCSAVYASPIYSVRSNLWNHLASLQNDVQGPWTVLGDFNEILNFSEVSGGSFSISRDNLLANMMSDCNLMDLDIVGGHFTWRKNIQNGGHIRKKLDRVLAGIDWRLAFPHALVELLPSHGSDHNPLLMSCKKSPSIKAIFFHFQAAWIDHPEYGNLVENAWNQTDGNIIAKLCKVQDKSLIFNKEIFGNLFKRKRQLEARIKGVHIQLDSCASSDLIRMERQLQSRYNEVLAQEELLWYQKSRENWVKFGNKNTKFFHTQTIIRRRRNYVTGLDIRGIWCTDAEVLKNEAQAFFKYLFQSTDPCQPQCLELQFNPQIDSVLFNNLLHPVSLNEVKQALFSMSSYKAPGPDGFQSIFYKTYWSVVGSDIHKMICDAFSSGTFSAMFL